MSSKKTSMNSVWIVHLCILLIYVIVRGRRLLVVKRVSIIMFKVQMDGMFK